MRVYERVVRVARVYVGWGGRGVDGLDRGAGEGVGGHGLVEGWKQLAPDN